MNRGHDAGVELQSWLDWMEEAAREVDGRPASSVVLLARLGDLVRAAGTHLPRPAHAGRLIEALEPEAQARLALLIEALRHPPVTRLALGHEALILFTHRKRLLTLTLVRSSAFRLEELARGCLDALGGAIDGESQAVSKARLERLDYERLLAAADGARKGAESRMEKLKAIQDEADERLPRRGKW